MPSTFFGISIAQSGLAAQKRAMDVLGYNIAHANDPTYKRQRVTLTEGLVLAQSQEALATGSPGLGSGVRSGDVERVRDELLENRIRESTSQTAKWDFLTTSLAQIEAILGEPGDNGIQSDLDAFWDAWQKVANSPESLPVRSALIEAADTLCQRIQFSYAQMKAVSDDMDTSVVDRVNKINLIGSEIAALNRTIGNMRSGDVSANDLLNRRDALVLELSKIASITQHGEASDAFILSVGGRVLVQGTIFNEMKTEISSNGVHSILWASDNAPVLIRNGELKAILDLRDTAIPDFLAQFDKLTTSLRDSVNNLHETGYTLTGAEAGHFFNGTSTAANFSLDINIINNPAAIAVSGTGSVGDNSIASSIANLKFAVISDGETINQMYRSLVGDISAQSAMAEKQSTAHHLSLDQYNSQFQSVSGVSLDEEMANIIKFQQAYNANARALTVMDEMLEMLIMRTGVVGR